jgi:hypothetical protein
VLLQLLVLHQVLFTLQKMLLEVLTRAPILINYVLLVAFHVQRFKFLCYLLHLRVAQLF